MAVKLDGKSLDIESVVRIARENEPVEVTDDAWVRIGSRVNGEHYSFSVRDYINNGNLTVLMWCGYSAYTTVYNSYVHLQSEK